MDSYSGNSQRDVIPLGFIKYYLEHNSEYHILSALGKGRRDNRPDLYEDEDEELNENGEIIDFGY